MGEENSQSYYRSMSDEEESAPIVSVVLSHEDGHQVRPKYKKQKVVQ